MICPAISPSASASRASIRSRAASTDMYRHQLWTHAPVRRLRERQGVQRALPLPARARLDRALDGLRPADPARAGLRRPALPRRGRPDRRRDRHDRRHAHGVRRDPARQGLDVDDDQRARGVLLLLYELVGEEQGVPSAELRGTTQNDILKEYIARGNFIYPPEGAMRLTTDLFAYCKESVPKWNTISISGYHFREKGCSAVRGRVHARQRHRLRAGGARRRAGGRRLRPRLAFFFNGHNNVFQEVAKFRAARRMWAQIMRERFGAQDERSAAALPHADGRRDAHRPAAREQHRPGGAPGLRGGLRRHAVAAHQRLRRGPRAAHRAGGEDRAAHPADHRPRVRRGRHRRPLRGLLLRRVADRRDRDPRAS